MAVPNISAILGFCLFYHFIILVEIYFATIHFAKGSAPVAPKKSTPSSTPGIHKQEAYEAQVQ